VKAYNIPFFVIGAGKWRRYFSWLNALDIFKVIIGFFQSIMLVWHEKPDLLISAGGFVSVPLHWAGAFLGVPSWVHQQDVLPGLAIRFMVPVAKKITTALKETTRFFPKRKTEWFGNPLRKLSVESQKNAQKKFAIPENAEAVIFALGGGTGSSSINKMIIEALPSWPKNWHIIHLTGKERPGELHTKAAETFTNYHVYSFFTSEMGLAYSAADVVVARAGFGTLTELAYFSKASVIMPMPHTHQEENVEYFEKQGAVIRLYEEVDTGLKLGHVVSDLIRNPSKRHNLGTVLHGLIPIAEKDRIIKIIHFLTKFDKVVKKN
jgi:UDP-N-acetylglucosamine--N-acetylmuramyl-(pentapeptide) pyrophosphoryl-undecaprenol N-acetylglucosamine transferase